MGDGQNTPPNDSPEEPLPKEPLWDATAAVKLAFGESQSELDQDATPEFEKQAGKSKPPTPVALINQKDTFKEAATELHDSIANLHKENIGEKPILYRTTPGIGKTEGAIHLATNLSKGDAENSPLMPFMATTTRNMAWQAYERIKGGFYGYGHQVLMFEGRHDGYDRKRVTPDGYTESIEVKPNCENYEKVQRARQKGYPIQKFVCAKCPSYPHFKDEWGQKTGWGCSCKYFRTLGRVTNIIPHSSDHYPPIVLMSHAMAANVLSESELVQPSFVIADEDMTTSFRDEVVWSEEELGRLIVGKSFIALRALMRETIALVKKYKKQIDFPLGPTTEKDQSDLSKELRKLLTDAKFYDSLTIHGKALARFMEVAAQKAGFDIDQILEDAMLAEEPVDKGDLASMTDENFARLPHYKEIELAKELGSIRQLAQKDEERAYRVSLRYGSDSTWSYYWDEVRTITYGGPLVLLDAYADPKLAERLCNREVEVRDVHCKVRENVMVEHYPKVSTSRSSMDDPTYKKNLFEMWIAPALRRSKGKKVLIYTQKRYAEWIESEVEKWDFGLKACVIKWFWMDRGDDSYGDFDDIFVVGTPYSNIVGERHFVNAMFAGDEPIDFSKGPGFKAKDERVQAMQEMRQDKELLQALFRIRPSKPREKPQRIVVFSKMPLNVNIELNGSTSSVMSKPDVDNDEVYEGLYKLMKRFGFWSHAMAAFAYDADRFIEWVEGGGADNPEGPFFDHHYIRLHYRLIRNSNRYASFIKYVGAAKPISSKILYRGKQVAVWGSTEAALDLFDHIHDALREPGCDEEVYDPKASEQIVATTELDPADDDQVASEVVSEEMGDELVDPHMPSDEDMEAEGWKPVAVGGDEPWLEEDTPPPDDDEV